MRKLNEEGLLGKSEQIQRYIPRLPLGCAILIATGIAICRVIPLSMEQIQPMISAAFHLLLGK